MDKYKFNSSGTQLLELVLIVISNICDAPWVADSFFYEGADLKSLDTFNSRIYSNQQDFTKMWERLVNREPSIIQDAQKIVNMFQNTNDIEGQKFLIDLIKGIDKNKIVGNKLSFDLHMSKVYRGFLYKDGRADRGFRMNNPEINKFLLIHVLEFTNPGVEKDFKVLVDNAESLGIPDEDIEKIYKMLKYKYSQGVSVQQGTQFDDNPFMREYRFESMQKSFAPVKERLEIKKQQQAEEEMPKTLEEALEEIRRLRQEVKDLRTHNNVLAGRLKIQSMQPGNANVGMMVQQERDVLHI